MSSGIIALIALGCTILGAAINKLWSAATEFTTFRAELAKTKQDVNNLGAVVRKNDTKQERRNKQILSALLDTHAENPQDVKRLSTLLRDDSWE